MHHHIISSSHHVYVIINTKHEYQKKKKKSFLRHTRNNNTYLPTAKKQGGSSAITNPHNQPLAKKIRQTSFHYYPKHSCIQLQRNFDYWEKKSHPFVKKSIDEYLKETFFSHHHNIQQEYIPVISIKNPHLRIPKPANQITIQQLPNTKKKKSLNTNRKTANQSRMGSPAVILERRRRRSNEKARALKGEGDPRGWKGEICREEG